MFAKQFRADGFCVRGQSNGGVEVAVVTSLDQILDVAGALMQGLQLGAVDVGGGVGGVAPDEGCEVFGCSVKEFGC